MQKQETIKQGRITVIEELHCNVMGDQFCDFTLNFNKFGEKHLSEQG